MTWEVSRATLVARQDVPRRAALAEAMRARAGALEWELKCAAMEYPANAKKIARLSAAMLDAEDRARRAAG